MLDAFQRFKQLVNEGSGALAGFVKLLAFLLNPKVFIPAAFVVLLLGIAAHAKDALLLPIGLGLALYALVLFARGK